MPSSQADDRTPKCIANCKTVYRQEAAQGSTFNGEISGGVNATRSTTYERGGNSFSGSHNQSTFERVITAGSDVHMPTFHLHLPPATRRGPTEERSLLQQIFGSALEYLGALVHRMAEETVTMARTATSNTQRRVDPQESTQIQPGCEDTQNDRDTKDDREIYYETMETPGVPDKFDSDISPMSDLDLQSLKSQSTTHAVIYTLHMLGSCTKGLPCWRPSPCPPTGPKGVVPGDVGTFNLVRGFRKIFNLWEKDCKGSSRLPSETTVSTDHFPNGHVIPSGITSRGVRSADGSSILNFDFTCNDEKGALLVCTSSADLVELHSTAALQKFLIDNAGAVYRYANDIQPLGTEESLYIITGCVKSDGWSLAAFRGARTDQHLKLSKRHLEDDSTSIGKIYDWTDQGPAEARLWPSTAKQAEGCEKNQSLFLQGFKLAFSAPFRARMDGLDTNVPGEDPSNSDQTKDRLDDSPSRPSRGDQSGSGDGMPGGSSNSSSTTSGGSSSSNQMQINSFPDTVHPCDMINKFLLAMTDADCALSHDNDWRYARAAPWWEDGYVKARAITASREILVSGGVAYLNTKPRHRIKSDGSCMRFNNATQRVFGGSCKPVVYVWETDDIINPWRAEARLLQGDTTVTRFPQSSAFDRKTAKDRAAMTAYQWLCAQFPQIDLADV